MAGMREIKRRVKSIKSTQQITRAMKMVSAAKLRRAQDRAITARPFAFKLKEILTSVAENSTQVVHPLLASREVKKIAVIVLTSDRGLCGGYNSNILKQTRYLLESKKDAQVELITVGRKAFDFFKRTNYPIKANYVGLPDNIPFAQAKEIAKLAIEAYEKTEVDEVYLIYNKFVSAMQQTPTTVKLLPLESENIKGTEKLKGEYLYEPSPEEILSTLLPKYIEILIYQTLLESKASEHGARMVAMGSATENAGEMIDKLTLIFNRARQASITKEISEIVGGAEAMEH